MKRRLWADPDRVESSHLPFSPREEKRRSAVLSIGSRTRIELTEISLLFVRPRDMRLQLLLIVKVPRQVVETVGLGQIAIGAILLGASPWKPGRKPSTQVDVNRRKHRQSEISNNAITRYSIRKQGVRIVRSPSTE